MNLILLDASMRVAYASPNGVSALHRIGVHEGDLEAEEARSARHPAQTALRQRSAERSIVTWTKSLK